MDQQKWFDGKGQEGQKFEGGDDGCEGLLDLLWQERASAQTLGEGFRVDAESRSDSNSGDDAGVDVSVDARSAEAEEPSYLGNR